MTVAFWCVFVAAVLPYIGTGIAKVGGRMPVSANRNPREWLETLQGWSKRGHWYEQNSFEAFPAFAAAVIIAQLTHALQARIDVLAIAFISFRLLYCLFYLADLASLRTAAWIGGLACVVWLFVLSA